jgi:hypothetical protein
LTALILVTSLGLNAQKPADLAGTWGGDATLDMETDSNFLTLILELKEGKLSGHMTGEYGTLDESPLSEILLEGEVFSFKVMAAGPGGGEVAITFKMKVSGDSMEGILEIPDMGASGTWEANKQK